MPNNVEVASSVAISCCVGARHDHTDRVGEDDGGVVPERGRDVVKLEGARPLGEIHQGGPNRRHRWQSAGVRRPITRARCV